MTTKKRNNRWFGWIGAFTEKRARRLAAKKLKVLSEFMYADDITKIRELIKAGADVNVRTECGGTPLWLASQRGHGEIVKVLLEAKANVNAARKTDGVTSLMTASWNGHTDIVKLLLEAKADVNAADTDGATSLWMASRNGHSEIVKLLLAKGANKNIKGKVDGRIYSPIEQAEKEGHTLVVYLLKDYPDIIANARNGNIDGVKKQLDSGVEVNFAIDDDVTSLWMASWQGHMEIVKLLLKAGADVNAADKHGETPLMIALENDHSEVVKLLLKAGVDLHYKNDIVLRSACHRGNVKLVRRLLELGANVNAFEGVLDDCTPLHAATYSENLALVTLLLDRGAIIDARDDMGNTSLYWASSSDLARLLLRRGANPNLHNGDGYTPLMINVIRRFDHMADNEEKIEILVAHGADPTIVNQYGETPLLFAQRAMADGSNTTLLPILLKANN